MNNFKMIEKLGLTALTYEEMSCEFVVNAKDLEALQSWREFLGEESES